MEQPVDSGLLSGPLRPAVLRVALPAAAFQLLIFLNNFVDYQWVQMLGKEAAAGQTAGWTAFWMLASMGQIFSTGITAVVARRVGEGDHVAALHSASHGLRGALLGSLLVGAFAYFALPGLVVGNTASEKAAGYTTDYLHVVGAGVPFLFLFYGTEGGFKGRGDMRTPLRAVATALALNMVLDPLLIHVAGLEVLGAGLATIIAFAVTGLLLVWTGRRRKWLAIGVKGLDLALIRRVVRIGTPLSVHGIAFSAVYIVIVTEVNRAGGDAGTAALGLGIRVEGFAYMVGVGFAAAAAAVVGQNLGAGQVGRAHAGAWTATRTGLWISGTYGLLMLIAPRGLVAVLSPDDPVVTAYAMDYLAFCSAAVYFTVAETILEGAFSGAGDTLPPMLLGIPLTVVRVPAAVAVGPIWGVGGIFWVLTITAALRGVILAFWFARGNWAQAKA
jgi:putative MATE family efflux protein